jgi:hypothetical protein
MQRHGRRPRLKVGDHVGVPKWPTPVEGWVTEDRGDLGVGGEQVVGVYYVIEPDVEVFTEHSVSVLVPPPDPAAPEPRKRRRAAARRVAPA